MPSGLRRREVLLEDAADTVENVGGQLPVSFAGEVYEIDELFVFAVQMRMCVDEADFRVFRRQLAEDEGMNRVGPHEPVGGARAAAPVKVDDLRVAGLVDRHGEIGQRQTNAVGAGALDEFAVGGGVWGCQRPGAGRRGGN